MTTELAVQLAGLLASIGYALHAHATARRRAEETHGKLVASIISRAEHAETLLEAERKAHASTLADCEAAEERARHLHTELSAQMQGTRVARPKERS